MLEGLWSANVFKISTEYYLLRPHVGTTCFAVYYYHTDFMLHAVIAELETILMVGHEMINFNEFSGPKRFSMHTAKYPCGAQAIKANC
jgi:hypothetical protein